MGMAMIKRGIVSLAFATTLSGLAHSAAADTLVGLGGGSRVYSAPLGSPGTVGDFSTNDLRQFTFDGVENPQLVEFQVAGSTIYGLGSGSRIYSAPLGNPGSISDFSPNDLRQFTFDGTDNPQLVDFEILGDTIYGLGFGNRIYSASLGAPGSTVDFSANDLRQFTFDGVENPEMVDFQIVGDTIYGLAFGNRLYSASLGAPGSIIDFSPNDLRQFTFDGVDNPQLVDFQIVGNIIYGLGFGNRIYSASLGAPGSILDFSPSDMRQFTFDGVENPQLAAFQVLATSAAVPEPSTWTMMILGFGGVGAAMRVRSRGRISRVGAA